MITKFDKVIEITNNYIPNIKIKYKDKSLLMKILSKLLFFNKDFMNKYTTTIGNTIYFPTENFINTYPISSISILLHECVHISDSRKNPLFKFLYLTPQILFLLRLYIFIF